MYVIVYYYDFTSKCIMYMGFINVIKRFIGTYIKVFQFRKLNYTVSSQYYKILLRLFKPKIINLIIIFALRTHGELAHLWNGIIVSGVVYIYIILSMKPYDKCIKVLY